MNGRLAPREKTRSRYGRTEFATIDYLGRSASNNAIKSTDIDKVELFKKLH